MLRKIFVALTAITVGLFTNAQVASVTSDTTATPATVTEDAKPALIITGSADVYYKYDFAKTKANNYTSPTLLLIGLSFLQVPGEHMLVMNYSIRN